MLQPQRSAIQVLFSVIVSGLLFTSCGGGGGGGSAPPATPAVTLQSIAVSQQNPTTAVNSVLQLTAIGTYSDSTTQNITTSVTWSSASSAIATVSMNSGLVAAASARSGQTVVITATSGILAPATTTVSFAAAPIPPFSHTASDPLAVQQWGLRNTGQSGYADTGGTLNTELPGTDINVASVYSTYGYTGWGVTVAVIDSGLEIAHEDLSANVVPGGSWNFINSTTDPTNTTATTGDHGTSVSGLIAMAKNSIGGIGVAPKARLKGFNPLSTLLQSTPNYVASLGGSTASPNSSDVAIFNQSYGFNNTADTPVDTTIEAQYASGTSTLRGGKGALYVKSAGNGYSAFGLAYCTGATGIGISCQNANFDPENTLPYNIVMAALNAKGKKSSYSTAGSAIWVSAPGGEYGYNSAVTSGLSAVYYDPAMVTTDQSGCTNGYSRTAATSSLFNKGGTNLSNINLSCNYTNGFNGTSSAAPMMSGVIALLLEANPALTWREVKDILARTSIQVDAMIAAVNITSGMTGASVGAPYVAEQGWITNAAGRKFHNWYGFGAVNASAAVAMARTYTSGSLGTFANTGWINSGTLNLAVPDNSITGVTTTLVVPKVGVSGIVEAVQIQVTTAAVKGTATTGCTPTTDGCTGDIAIELISPSGTTKSILKNIKDGFDGFYLSGMVLASNAFYGENSTGNWRVKVVDGWVGSGNQTVTNVQIRVYGH